MMTNTPTPNLPEYADNMLTNLDQGIIESMDNYVIEPVKKPLTREEKMILQVAKKASQCYDDVLDACKHGQELPEPFIWYLCAQCRRIFPDMDPAHVTRLMYAATFAGYNGILVNYHNNPLTVVGLEQRMGLSHRYFKIFMDDMIQRKIFKENDQKLIINQSIFSKGVLPPNRMVDAAREGSIITRVYINSVRNLYEHSMRQSDKALSYLFQMIPFIHYKYHMLCFNPLEKQRDDVIWMTVEDFADAIGFDQKNIKRLYTTLFKPDFLLNGVVCKAVAGIDTGEHTFNRFHIVVNPHLFSAGPHLTTQEEAILLEKMQNNTTYLI